LVEPRRGNRPLVGGVGLGYVHHDEGRAGAQLSDKAWVQKMEAHVTSWNVFVCVT
jgi:hypothetical protein